MNHAKKLTNEFEEANPATNQLKNKMNQVAKGFGDIPQEFRDALPSGAITEAEVRFVEKKLLQFKKSVPMDHASLVSTFQASVQASAPDKPEGFKLTLKSVASVVLPSLGQVLVVRDSSGVMRPLFLQLPTPSQMFNVQIGMRPIMSSRVYDVYTKIPHPHVAGMMVPKLKLNQEHMILNIYKSPYGVSYQLHTLDGIPEPIVQSVTMYGTRDWQREQLSKFTGQDIADASNISLKSSQYKSLPLGTFTAMYELIHRELQHNVSKIPVEIRASMAKVFATACQLGGHNPFNKSRDEEYVSNPDKELTTQDFFPAVGRQTTNQMFRNTFGDHKPKVAKDDTPSITAEDVPGYVSGYVNDEDLSYEDVRGPDTEQELVPAGFEEERVPSIHEQL